MKLAPEVLLEIMAIFQDGIIKQQDISQGLRDLDLVVKSPGSVQFVEPAELSLSDGYLATHPRGAQWQEE